MADHGHVYIQVCTGYACFTRLPRGPWKFWVEEVVREGGWKGVLGRVWVWTGAGVGGPRRVHQHGDAAPTGTTHVQESSALRGVAPVEVLCGCLEEGGKRQQALGGGRTHLLRVTWGRRKYQVLATHLSLTPALTCPSVPPRSKSNTQKHSDLSLIYTQTYTLHTSLT